MISVMLSVFLELVAFELERNLVVDDFIVNICKVN